MLGYKVFRRWVRELAWTEASSGAHKTAGHNHRDDSINFLYATKSSSIGYVIWNFIGALGTLSAGPGVIILSTVCRWWMVYCEWGNTRILVREFHGWRNVLLHAPRCNRDDYASQPTVISIHDEDNPKWNESTLRPTAGKSDISVDRFYEISKWKFWTRCQSETPNSIIIFFIFLDPFIRTNKKRKDSCP